MTELQRKSGLDYPHQGLTDMTRGFRGGEIVTLCAGTGIGKSTACTEFGAHWFPQIPDTDRVGYIALEENYGLSALKFCTIQAGRPLHLDDAAPDRSELEGYYAPYKDRLVLYNHFGSIGSDSLLSKIRYMVVGLECKWLVLDHLSIVVSGMDQSDDERRTIDHLMTSLRSLVEQTGAGLLLVSHLKRLYGATRGYEQGTEPQLSHLRGSAAIEQLSDVVLALSRNQQDEEGAANLAKVRVLKNRWTGQTGTAGYMQYSLDTGRLIECAGPDDTEDHGFAAEPSEFDVPQEVTA
jgi:twinkle protein